MFTVILVLCIGQGAACYTVTDVWGPYGTLEKCEARLEEMVTDINKALGPVQYFDKKCIKDKKEGFV